jgi:hypothetical protein
VNSGTLDEVAELLERASWIVVVVLGAWVGFGLVACSVARAAPRVRAAQRAARWSPALVRRVAGVACTASFVLGPQLTQPAGAVADEPVVRAQQAWVPAGEVPPPPPPAPAPPLPPSASRHVVAPGDNLWLIARTTLGGEPAESEVVRYWSKLIDVNRASLRSGDPSLIYPGEIVVLPPRGN